MTQTTLRPEPTQVLETPENATWTSQFEISQDARDAYAAMVVDALDRADDLMIALEIRTRESTRGEDSVDLADFIREQGYDPAEFTS